MHAVSLCAHAATHAGAGVLVMRAGVWTCQNVDKVLEVAVEPTCEILDEQRPLSPMQLAMRFRGDEDE